MNVLTPMLNWISGSIPNEGWILKHDSSLENNTTDYE